MITTEFQPSKVARARENLLAGGLADLIGLREGDALHTLAHDLPNHIYLELLDSRVSHGPRSCRSSVMMRPLGVESRRWRAWLRHARGGRRAAPAGGAA
jgi:predicted O-methyltransferase YrrM